MSRRRDAYTVWPSHRAKRRARRQGRRADLDLEQPTTGDLAADLVARGLATRQILDNTGHIAIERKQP